MTRSDFANLRIGTYICLTNDNGCIGGDYHRHRAKIVKRSGDEVTVMVETGPCRGERISIHECCADLFDQDREPDDCLKAINRHRAKNLQRKLDTAGWTDDDLRIEAMRLGV